MMYGAAHYQPQVFQVVTTQTLRPIQLGAVKIVFYGCKKWSNLGLDIKKTPTGEITVATTERTALDMVKYYKDCGGISNVCNILKEIPFKLGGLIKLVPIYTSAYVQRLGYLLDYMDYDTGKLYKQIKNRYIPLCPNQPVGGFRDEKWKIYINEEIDIE